MTTTKKSYTVVIHSKHEGETSKDYRFFAVCGPYRTEKEAEAKMTAMAELYPSRENGSGLIFLMQVTSMYK